MRIISKFHDYYDGAAKSFYDKEGPFYNRKIEITHVFLDKFSNDYVYNLYWKHSSNRRRETNSLFILGVCGKLYPVYLGSSLSIMNLDKPGHYDSKIPSILYPNDINYDDWDFGWRWIKKEKVNNTVNELSNNQRIKKLFLEFKVPVFLLSPVVPMLIDTKNLTPNLILNPPLSLYEFQRVVDPYTICQELSMFLGNQLVEDKQPKIPVGTDVQLAESKGFDKWSFRKRKRYK